MAKCKKLNGFWREEDEGMYVFQEIKVGKNHSCRASAGNCPALAALGYWH